MANISSFTSLNRDNVINLIKRADFFEKNPYLQPFAEQFETCRQNAAAAKKKSSCSCSGNGAKLYIPCVENILGALTDAKTDAPEAVATFVQYVTTHDVGSGQVKLLVYYTKNNGSQSHRYEFVA
jgi:hypothetical protein